MQQFSQLSQLAGVGAISVWGGKWRVNLKPQDSEGGRWQSLAFAVPAWSHTSKTAAGDLWLWWRQETH